MLFWIYENGYNLMLGLGGASAIALIVLRRQQYNLSVWQASALGLVLMLCAIVGAKLLYILENQGDTTGMSLFGAVFSVLLCVLHVLICKRINKRLKCKCINYIRVGNGHFKIVNNK